MAKKAYIGVSGAARRVKKAYVGIGGTARKITKGYIGVGGVARLFMTAEASAEDLSFTFTGTLTDYGVVPMTGGDYRLLMLTSSGTLSCDSDVEAEYWMCGGGSCGGYYLGGNGAFTAQGNISLDAGVGVAAVIGAGAVRSKSRIAGGATTLGSFSAAGAAKLGGGTGGGEGKNTAGTGDGLDKHPFLDSGYFLSIPCAGGGAGNGFENGWYDGGDGGSNGSNGGDTRNLTKRGGAGGETGGGTGAIHEYEGVSGSSATFYGSGGGGGSYNEDNMGFGGSGYQGVIYIRVPA